MPLSLYPRSHVNREPMRNTSSVSTNVATFLRARWIEDMSDNCNMYIPLCWVEHEHFEGTQKCHYLNIVGVSWSFLSSRYSSKSVAGNFSVWKLWRVTKGLCAIGQNWTLKETKFGPQRGKTQRSEKQVPKTQIFFEFRISFREHKFCRNGENIRERTIFSDNHDLANLANK